MGRSTYYQLYGQIEATCVTIKTAWKEKRTEDKAYQRQEEGLERAIKTFRDVMIWLK